MNEIRTERSFGVTAELKTAQRVRLTALLHSDVYEDVLDVMEMVCIELETKLINTDPADRAAVLANHQMAKSSWLIFTHLQEKIAAEAAIHLQSTQGKPPVPALSAHEQLIENILDPTRHMTEEDETVM